jgi:hypothetical protein
MFCKKNKFCQKKLTYRFFVKIFTENFQVSSDYPPSHSAFRTNRKEDALLLIFIGCVAGELNVVMSSVQSYASIPYSQVCGFVDIKNRAENCELNLC